MAHIICPHCNEIFSLDDTQSHAIIQQVRTTEFEQEVEKRVQEQVTSKLDLFKADAALTQKTEIQKVESSYQKEISKLKDELSDSNHQITQLQNDLQAQKNTSDAEHKLELSDLKAKHTDEITKLNQDHSSALQALQVEVDYYKDLKTKMSTKMIGETLEQHCELEFNKLRPLAFPNAYFEKDSDVSASGTKGDYIYREFDTNGEEILSIMFEMKNEMNTTATKHHNADFYKKLDKDRKTKQCEYAILVSLLESDNELFNQGIVDVSHEYEKMYVIRPQFFIPIISLLRNAALKSLQYKHELTKIKHQHLDITNFEQELLTFKHDFGRNYQLASEHFDKAVGEIDRAIERLQKVKEFLTKSNTQLRYANDKADKLTLQKLAKNSPSLLEQL